jgi:haloalkane dehalogenase
MELPDGGLIHYLDEGEGPPVLMVHGNPSWSFMYRSLVKALSPNYRCLVPDHLGMGLSSRPGDGEYGFRLADRLSDLSAFMASLNLTEPVHVVGHDWGGPIGFGWAGANPAKVASITVLNTGLRAPAGYSIPRRLSLFRKTGAAGRFLANQLNLFLWGVIRQGSVRPLSKAATEGWLAPYRFSFLRKAIGRFVEDIPLSPSHVSWSESRRIDRDFDDLAEVPTLLAFGLKDFVFTPAFLADFQARRPRAEVLALPRSGHLLLEDEPDRIAAAISSHLAKSSKARSGRRF